MSEGKKDTQPEPVSKYPADVQRFIDMGYAPHIAEQEAADDRYVREMDAREAAERAAETPPKTEQQ